jgi:hypothetical protein
MLPSTATRSGLRPRMRYAPSSSPLVGKRPRAPEPRAAGRKSVDSHAGCLTYVGTEGLNMSLRKVIKTRGSFPNEEAALKLLCLALERIAKKWTRPVQDWKAALNRFAILYEDRLPRGVPACDRPRVDRRGDVSASPWSSGRPRRRRERGIVSLLCEHGTSTSLRSSQLLSTIFWAGLPNSLQSRKVGAPRALRAGSDPPSRPHPVSDVRA